MQVAIGIVVAIVIYAAVKGFQFYISQINWRNGNRR